MEGNENTSILIHSAGKIFQMQDPGSAEAGEETEEAELHGREAARAERMFR